MNRKFVFICFYLCIATISSAQTYYEKGKIIDSLKVSGTENHTFALYLPESFDPDTLSSIVFIFEPAARGKIGIQPFIQASEKYGHILVCSNDCRNGPYERNFEIANKLFTHIFSNFSIKNDEMYLSGFSGGSRLATTIATLTNLFAGVVACGAGFSHVREHMPSTQNYAYVGMCGDRDMNYKEMLKNTDFLGLLKFNSTLITYDGEHRWPPKEQIERAMDWLNLQKLRKSESKVTEEILRQYQQDYILFKKFEEADQLLYSSEQLQRMLNDYNGLIAVDSLKKIHGELLQSDAYKKSAADLESALKIEKKVSDKFLSRIREDFKKPSKANFKWWEKEIAKLNAIEEKGDEETRKMVYRIKFDLFARAYSRKNALLHDVDKEKIELAERLLELIHPQEK